ncbi:MAG: formimidoylglutamate deiminase [Myxococcaceae bacterium]|nr:MAG: formimidoylglutamate deiminase [Myxococcaceae bacterium]
MRAIDGTSLVLPGWVSAHSHAFQYGLRGHTQRAPGETGTFWSWREAMFSLADSLTPESLAAVSRDAFRALYRSGVRCVGEFHYVHHPRGGGAYAQRTLLSDVVIEAALAEGLRVTLLRVAYARSSHGRPPEGAQRRFCDGDVDDVLRDLDALRSRWGADARVRVGVAPHSVRAVPREWLGPLDEYATRYALPFHMHVAEVIGEVESCLAEHGRRPVELLSEAGVLNERFVAVHATNLEPHEARLLGEARAFACLCPTTERDLGDGLADIAALREAGVRLCVGIDSHVVTDPVEEMRALETHERLRLRRRVTFAGAEGRTLAEQLLVEGSAHGALACGWDAAVRGRETAWDADTVVDLESAPLRGVAPERVLDALVFSGHPGCVRR